MTSSRDEFPLAFRSATELAAAIRAREVSATELLDHYLERVDRLNPQINAVVTLDVERARAVAAVADDATMMGRFAGPLHGLPITIKDALAVAGVRCTGGAVELIDNVPDEDATVVARVKAAGAIVFGKTNLPRWSADAQATNEIFGTTNNPWDLTRGPGGSSGGASAAISAGLTSFDIGTDIGGSIRMPAHFAGVCGHKPSFGIVPALGYIDHPTAGLTEPDVNVVGPLARSVDDLEMVLDVIAGPTPDRELAWRLDLPPARHGSLRHFRVGAWLDDPACRIGSDVGAVLEEALASLESAGAGIDRTARPEVPFDEVSRLGLPLISAATSPGRSDEEFAAMAELTDNPPEGLDPVVAMRARATAVHHRTWALQTEERELIRRRWADFFTRFDILLCPVAASAAFPHQLEGGIYDRTIEIDGVLRPYADVIKWTSFIGFAYLPSTVVPVGLTSAGLPVGIQVVAPFLEDRTALAFARHVEVVTGGYQAPPIS